MTRYAIDYSKCMFCALCVPPCPTDCIHMGDLHDMSGYDRKSMIVEFTDLAKEGLQTPQPLWMHKDKLPGWANDRKQAWLDNSADRHGVMIEALSESKPPPKPKPAAKPKAAAKPAPAAAQTADSEKPKIEKPAETPPPDAPQAEASKPERDPSPE
jgi:ferredoxin